MKPFGEIGAIFSVQLSLRTQFTKISNKRVIAENQFEKHKKNEFSPCIKQTVCKVLNKFQCGKYLKSF